MTSTLSPASTSPWPLPPSNFDPHMAPPSTLDSPDQSSSDDQTPHHSPSAVAPFPVADTRMNASPQPKESVLTPSLLYLSFNQDEGCFAAGTNTGFRIYNCDPLIETNIREKLPPISTPNSATVSGSGIGIVQMLFRSNYLALVGGGQNPQYPLNKVMLWDDHTMRCFGELSFRSEVKSVRFRRDCVVVVLLQKVYVYEFPSLTRGHEIETVENPRGLCEVSQTSASRVLVCPGLQKGQVRVEHYSSKRTKYIAAHDSSLACLALTNDGRFLATASNKGTLIRIHNTLDGSLLQEVRRGADRAEIYSIAFSSNARWLAVSSDKGTIHVFNLKFDSGSLGSERYYGASGPKNSTSSAVSHFSFIKGVLPKYFSSEWSVAQFRLPEGLRSIVAFGHRKNTVVILSMDGSFYRCQFNPVVGGEMTLLEHHNFLKPKHTF